MPTAATLEYAIGVAIFPATLSTARRGLDHPPERESAMLVAMIVSGIPLRKKNG